MGFDPKTMNTTALAYIGDAVYEIYVRERVLAASARTQGGTQEQSGSQLQGAAAKGPAAFGAHVDALHKRAIRYVRADGQAKALRAMLKNGFLTVEEEALVRRARNHKSASKPKNADAMDYKYATALEALIGYWHLTAARAGAEPEHAEAETPSAAEKHAAQVAASAAEAQKRMEEIIFRAFEVIEKKEDKHE